VRFKCVFCETLRQNLAFLQQLLSLPWVGIKPGIFLFSFIYSHFTTELQWLANIYLKFATKFGCFCVFTAFSLRFQCKSLTLLLRFITLCIKIALFVRFCCVFPHFCFINRLFIAFVQLSFKIWLYYCVFNTFLSHL
jgi:hypothetical protein